MSKYFKAAEFTRCNPSCDISQMDAAFLDLMDRVRELAGIPLVINSAYRSKSWEMMHGRNGTSAHCKGKALDIRCNTSANRFRIVAAAITAGIKRIGIGKTFVHLDNDGTLPQRVMWDYYDD